MKPEGFFDEGNVQSLRSGNVTDPLIYEFEGQFPYYLVLFNAPHIRQGGYEW